MNTLIDTSAWISVLRPMGDKTLQSEIERLLKEERAAITAPVWLELYQGIKSKREQAQLNNLRSLCIWLEFSADCWELTATHARTCRRKGANVPTSDLLIYCCAEIHKTKLLHRDKHFELITSALQ